MGTCGFARKDFEMRGNSWISVETSGSALKCVVNVKEGASDWKSVKKSRKRLQALGNALKSVVSEDARGNMW